MRRRAFLRGAAAVVGAAGRVRQGLGQSRGRELPPGFALLRATQGEITIDGKTAKVYHLLQDNGAKGYVGVKGQGFRVVLDNATPGPLSVHWHGLILPNGQDGVPYVTQRPLTPGKRRLYEFPLEQAETYWMHSHWGLQDGGSLRIPLVGGGRPRSPACGPSHGAGAGALPRSGIARRRRRRGVPP